MISRSLKGNDLIYNYLYKNKFKQTKIPVNDSFNKEYEKLKSDTERLNAIINYKPEEKGEKIHYYKLSNEKTKTQEQNENKELLDKILKYDLDINELNKINRLIDDNIELTDSDKDLLKKYKLNENKEDISKQINELTKKKEEEQNKIYKLKSIDLKRYVNQEISLLNKNYSFFTYEILKTIKKDKDVRDTVKKIGTTYKTIKEWLNDGKLTEQEKELITSLINEGKIQKDYTDCYTNIDICLQSV